MVIGEFLKKLSLFISAYFPLFIILTVKYFSGINPAGIFVIIVVTILTFFSIGFWAHLLKGAKKKTSEDYEIVDYKREINYPMSYLLTYIVSIIGFDLNSYQACLAFIALLILLFVVYSSSEVLLLNPLLYVWGYKFYDIKAQRTGLTPQQMQKKHLHALLISRSSRFTDEPITLNKLARSVMIEFKSEVDK